MAWQLFAGELHLDSVFMGKGKKRLRLWGKAKKVMVWTPVVCLAIK
jgi:hypothetical protein